MGVVDPATSKTTQVSSLAEGAGIPTYSKRRVYRIDYKGCMVVYCQSVTGSRVRLSKLNRENMFFAKVTRRVSTSKFIENRQPYLKYTVKGNVYQIYLA